MKQDFTSPKVIAEAHKLIGTAEIAGKQHNTTILNWAKDLGLEKSYNSDEIPWCGLFVAICVKRAGFEPIENPLWARNWAKWGNKSDVASFGDVLVFVRDGGGHVGFYVGEDSKCYHVLGGNQGNKVSIIRIEKTRCIAVRRCVWKVAQPESVKPVFLTPNGQISTNEQ